MGTQKENGLPERTTFSFGYYLRMVTNLITGASELVRASNIIWPKSNVDGLEDSLDLKADKETVAGLKNMLSYVKADGTFSGSGMLMQSLTSATSLESLVNTGIYTFPAGKDNVSLYGTIHDVFVLDNSTVGESVSIPTIHKSRALIFSDKGIFYRTYNSSDGGSGWSYPRFLGGGVMNYSGTRSSLMSMATANNLTPGALYVLTDHTNDNGIILEASTENTFNPNAQRLGLAPTHHLAGTFPTGSGGANETWLGVWRSGLSGVAIGKLTVHCNRVWRSLTGSVGGPVDTYDLDAANWALVPVESGSYYGSVQFSVNYDIATNCILTQRDSYGLELGYGYPHTTYLITDIDELDYCDWDFNKEYQIPVIQDVKQKLIYGNKFDYYFLQRIIHVTGTGQIYNNDFTYTSDVIKHVENDAYIYGCSTPHIEDTVVSGDISDVSFNNYKIINSQILSAISGITLTQITTIHESTGAIYACRSVGDGDDTFQVAPGTAWIPATGTLTTTSTCSNGVDVGTGVEFTVKYAGLYDISTLASAACSVKHNLETIINVYRAATSTDEQLVHLSNIKTYDNAAGVGAYINSSIHGIAILNVGDVVTVRYRHNNAGTLTYTMYKMTATIKYSN